MKETLEYLLSRTFIKLRSDYGFKRVFASPEHAEILRKFLNALFEGELVVKEVTFHNKEVLPPDRDGKRIVYDVYCTTDTGHHFVVEMQQEQSALFGKRMIFYVSSCIFRQGESGGSYKFDPVYVVVITDFDMKPFERRLVNEVVLMERNTHVVFTEDVRIFFLSLSQVSREWDDCRTELERQLYLIRNMENLNKESKPYRTGEYDEMFKAAEIASLAKEDFVEYKNSIMAEMERQSEIEFAREEGIEKGIAKGIEKGIVKGREQGLTEGIVKGREQGLTEGRKQGLTEGLEKGLTEGKLEVARKMKQQGMNLGDIMLFTGLTREQVQAL